MKKHAFTVYTVVICAAAASVTHFVVRLSPVGAWAPVFILAVLNFATENYAFRLPLAGSVSLSFAITYGAMLYSGPLGAIICAVAGSTTVAEWRERKPLLLRAFNAGQLAVSAGVSGTVYHMLGGHVLSIADGGPVLLPGLASAAIFFVLNVLLVSYGASIMKHEKVVDVLREQGFISYGASLVVLALLGVLIAYLLAERSWVGLVLLVLPFMSARRTFRVYAELSEAYTSTVRSLVAAIEAKDPYTRGHSERVAVFSRQLAESLGMSRPNVDLVERAALLHDVGKIGVATHTLTSTAQLAVEEIRAIRQHPVTGGNLVSDVEFLSDIVPVVRHHHERFDGAGYPDGLAGDRIPILARVLAVADCYDAMTSDRAYRAAMSSENALSELLRVAGSQLDPDFARCFVDTMLVQSEEAR